MALVPTMDFVGENIETLGLKGAFNTFRKGSKWHELLYPNDEINLRIPDAFGPGYTMTKGVITFCDIGPLDEMLAAHAPRNHAILLGKSIWTDDNVDAMNMLHALLGKIYDGASYDDEFSVIGIARPTWTTVKHFNKQPEPKEWR